MTQHDQAIEALAASEVRLEPSATVRERAAVPDYDAWYRSWADDPDAFWARAARELYWFEPWSAVSRIDGGEHEWFIGGKTNLSYNCFERNIERGLGDKVALYAESERGDPRSFAYREALAEVSRLSNALRALGVGHGDRVVLYMAIGPEGIFAMQACARIGALHSVVYAGMGADALRHRIEDCEAKAVVCSDVTYRRGAVVPLLPAVVEAVEGLACVEHVIVHRRESTSLLPEGWRDLDELTARYEPYAAADPVDSEHPAFLLYTSGTTGKPKGVVHVHGGYMVGVHMAMRNYFDTGEDDVWWSTSDIGWIVGHSFICYGPLLVGATEVVREGAPDYPSASEIWRLVEKYRVTTMFTAPTAVRMFMRLGEEALAAHDRSSLRVLFCAGEPFNPEAWNWAERNIMSDGGHVVDNYWQTEIAAPMIGTFPSMTARPGFIGKPLPGVILKAVTEDGEPVATGEGGLLVMERPVPYMMRTLYGAPERYRELWSEKLGGYVTGDIAVCDKEGYWAVLGRSDDVLNVAGHRIGTADIESALLTHAAVAESAAIGLPDELKGERIKVFVVARGGLPADEAAERTLAASLIAHVRRSLGPIATPSEVAFLEALPKTRSGKIVRRLLKARELGLEEGDTSTLEEGAAAPPAKS